MSQSLNKRKNNNIKFDKSPENFQINMDNINNLGNYKYAKGSKEEPKQEETKNADPEKAEEEAEVKTEEEKPVEQPKEKPEEEPKEETKKEQKEEVKYEPKEE